MNEEMIEMEGFPLISIVIPVYKAENFISACIDSVLKQDFAGFELILVDDGSPDNCPQICDKYAHIDSRVRVIHKNNTGVSAARNDAIKVSSGKYIMFVDADDLLPQGTLKKYISCVKKGEYDIVFGQHIQDYEGKQIFRKPRLRSGEYSYQDIKNQIIDDGTLTGFLFGNVWGGFYKREIITNNNVFFDENVRVNEDGLFNFKLVSKCNKICIIEDYVYIYRQWKSSKTNKLLNRDARFDACEEVLKDYIGNLEADFKLQLQRRKISILFWNTIRIRESKCNWKQAKKFLREILSDEELTINFETLDYSRMNIYKKLLCNSLKYHRFFLFYILIKYFAPILQSMVRR